MRGSSLPSYATSGAALPYMVSCASEPPPSFIVRTSIRRASKPERLMERIWVDVRPAIDLCFVFSGIILPPKTVAAASPPSRTTSLFL